MGANYNTILIRATEPEEIFAAIVDALRPYGFNIVHREEAQTPEEGFSYNSTQMIFFGPPDDCRWVPLTASGEGFPGSVEVWCCANPLAASLSQCVEPIIHLFSYDAGHVAGYSIFEGGDHREAQSVAWRRSTNLADFTSPIAPPSPPTLLGSLLGQSDFDYESFVRSFENLEVAAAALAARLGLPVHLLDPYDIDDGEGGIALVDGEYKSVSLVGWTAVYYA